MSEELLGKLCPDCRREVALWFDESRDKIKQVDRILASVKKVSDALHQFLDLAEAAFREAPPKSNAFTIPAGEAPR